MRDVEVAVPITDKAYVRPGAGQFAVDTTATDPAYGETTGTSHDKAQQEPQTGGELGVGRRAMLSGPADGGQADMANHAPNTSTVPKLVAPAYARTGRSANPANKVRLFPWLKYPRQGLTWSYESQGTIVLAAEEEYAALELQPPTPSPGPVGFGMPGGPGDDEEESDDEFEEVEEKDSEEKPSMVKRAKAVLKRGRKGDKS
jgi:hypothetical protein